IKRDRQRRLAVAIDNSGYAAGSALRPGGPLAGPRARCRLDHVDGRHVFVLKSLFISLLRAKILAGLNVRRQPPGVPKVVRFEPRRRAYSGANPEKQESPCQANRLPRRPRSNNRTAFPAEALHRFWPLMRRRGISAFHSPRERAAPCL